MKIDLFRRVTVSIDKDKAIYTKRPPLSIGSVLGEQLSAV
jgi:hypothetical protein